MRHSIHFATLWLSKAGICWSLSFETCALERYSTTVFPFDYPQAILITFVYSPGIINNAVIIALSRLGTSNCPAHRPFTVLHLHHHSDSTIHPPPLPCHFSPQATHNLHQNWTLSPTARHLRSLLFRICVPRRTNSRTTLETTTNPRGSEIPPIRRCSVSEV